MNEKVSDIDRKIKELEKRKNVLTRNIALEKIRGRQVSLTALLKFLKTIEGKENKIEHMIFSAGSYGGPDPDPSETRGLTEQRDILLWVIAETKKLAKKATKGKVKYIHLRDAKLI